jgi:hypothetical protein
MSLQNVCRKISIYLTGKILILKKKKKKKSENCYFFVTYNAFPTPSLKTYFPTPYPPSSPDPLKDSFSS